MGITIQNPPPKPTNPNPEEADLNGKQMSFLEHLEELRVRLLHSIYSVIVATAICFYFRDAIYGYLAKPLTDTLRELHLEQQLVYTNPVDPFNLYIKLAIMGGLFLASPYVLFQLWLFVSPGLYRNEKRYVLPFMFSTVGLFISGGFFGYKLVYPAALDFLIGYGKQFQPMITIHEYTDLFLTVILGLGVVFELPILVFFLALMGVISAGWMWRNVRYSILVIFIIAAILTPTTDILNMCIFAAPMVALYLASIGIAYLVHPKQRKARAQRKAQ